jgi:hypothetical protein
MRDNQASELPVERLVGTSTEAEEDETVESETVPSEVSPSEAGSTADGDVQENPESQVAG